MRRFAILTTATLLAGLTYSPVGGQTLPRGYEIIDITRENGLLERIPRINSRGDVVFFSNPSPTGGEIWLYEKASDTLTQITDDDVFDGLPDIADDGTIVWARWVGPERAGIGPTAEIFMRTPDGVITQITDDPDEDRDPSINSQHQIVWQKSGPWACGGYTQDIYLYDAGEITRITTNGSAENLENQSPQISDEGVIVWTEYNFCDPPRPYNFTSRIMLHSNGLTRSLPSLSVVPQIPMLNETGTVVWVGFDLALRQETVEVWDGSRTWQLTDDGGRASINLDGDIAFDRWNPSVGAYEIWLYRGGAFACIACEPVHNHTPKINDRLEITWVFGNLTNGDIRLMRRLPNGDLNCDGEINAFDIEAFLVALLEPATYPVLYPQCDIELADINGDGSVDAFDIEPFIQLLVP